MMKKLFGGLSLVIVLCLCGIAFYSCSNDDKNEPEMTSEKMGQRRSSVARVLTKYPADAVHEERQVRDTVQL